MLRIVTIVAFETVQLKDEATELKKFKANYSEDQGLVCVENLFQKKKIYFRYRKDFINIRFSHPQPPGNRCKEEALIFILKQKFPITFRLYTCSLRFLLLL